MFDKLKYRLSAWMHPKEFCSSESLYKVLFDAPYTTSVLKDVESICGIDLSKRPVQVAVVQVNGSCDPVILQKLIDFCTQANDSDEVLAVSDGLCRVLMLFFSDIVWEDQALEILEDLNKDFRTTWPDNALTIALGPIENDSEEGEPSWRKSYRKAVGLLDYRYIKSEDKIITYSEIISRRHIYPKGIEFRFSILKEHMEARNYEAVDHWLTTVYHILGSDKDHSFGLIYHLTLEIVVNIVSVLREEGLEPEPLIGTPQFLVEQVLQIETLQEMRMWTDALLTRVINILSSIDTVST